MDFSVLSFFAFKNSRWHLFYTEEQKRVRFPTSGRIQRGGTCVCRNCDDGCVPGNPASSEEGSCPFQSIGKASEEIVWCRPERVCTVEYMPNTLDALRQQVLRGYGMMWNGSRVYGIKKLPVLVRAAWCCLYCYSFIPKAE